MTISTITKTVAFAICSGPLWDIIAFIDNGDANEYLMFSHYNFYYSRPEWGTKRVDGSSCQFHRVEPVCHICKRHFERNYAGVGTMYLLHNGVGDREVRVSDGFEYRRGRKISKTKLVANTSSLSRMIILCRDHVKGYFHYKTIEAKLIDQESRQLSLF